MEKGGSFRERITYANSEETALTVAAVYRAADLRSDAIAVLKLQYLTRDNERNYMREGAFSVDRAVNYVLDVKPNGRQSAFQFWKCIEMMRMMRGHAYVMPVFGGDGVLKELVPCTGSWDAYRNTYTLKDVWGKRLWQNVDAEDVIVLRGIVTAAHPEGESIIHYAARTATVSATSETLALESAAKGGRQKLILQQKDVNGSGMLGGLSPDEMAKQAKRVQDSIYNDDVVYDDSGSDITPINLSMADLQLLESRKFTVSDIARFFGVPRSMLMDDSNSNYRTSEAASLEFLVRTMQPVLRQVEDEFNAKLLAPKDYGVHAFRFDVKNLFALDIASKTNRNKSRLETGMASVNELRAEENLPALPDGDEHYVSCNVAPIGSAKLSGGAGKFWEF